MRDQELKNLWVATEIERLLSGEGDGAALFQALYGAAADEPIPERLLAVLREGCETAIDAEDIAVLPAAAPSLDAAAS